MIIKLLFALIISVSLANASVSEEYNSAIKDYKNKNFKSSYKKLKKIYLKYLSNANFNFYLGRSAFETGNYEVALAAFERVEIMDAANIANRLEMARTYFMLKMYEDAELAFKDVLENPNIPKNIKNNIQLSLSRVSKVQQKSFTYAQVKAAIIYDSNINYGSIADYAYGGSTQAKVNNVSGTASELFANVTNIYDIGRKNDYMVKNIFTLYHKDYIKSNSYDINYLSYSPSLLFKKTKYTVDLKLGFDLTTLGNKSFLKSFTFQPQLDWRYSNTLKGIYSLKYKLKNFIQSSNDSLDANHFDIGYGLQKILSPRSYMQTNINIATERKIRGANVNVDYNDYVVNVTYFKQISSKFGVNTFGQIRKRNYKDYSSGFGSTRSDLSTSTNISLDYKMKSAFRLNLKASYEKTNSNQGRYSYDKYILSAGVTKTF